MEDKIRIVLESPSGLAVIIVKGFAVLVLTGLISAAHAFDLQGHRGARGLMPENTLPGFAAALAIGVTTLELDLAVTADSRVVVSHNLRLEPALARNGSGVWLQASSPTIRSMTLEKIKTYDVGRLNPGTKYAKRYPDQQAVDGTTIPTLDEVFELVKRSGNQKVHFNIEVKIDPENPQLTFAPDKFVQAVIDVIRSHQMETRVVVQSFDWRALQAVRDQAPAIITSYLTANQHWLDNLQVGMPGASPWLNGWDVDDFGGSAPLTVKAAGGSIWSPYHHEVSTESIRHAHTLGLSVTVWTVNDPGRMHELIAMGVDGIITDYPDRLRLVLEDLGMHVPAPTPVEL